MDDLMLVDVMCLTWLRVDADQHPQFHTGPQLNVIPRISLFSPHQQIKEHRAKYKESTIQDLV